MLKNQNIICISSIDWDFIWQGHQEIMSIFAKSGNRVIFIENTGVRAIRAGDISRIKNRIKNWFAGINGIRKEMENLYVFSPIVLPFPYSRIAMWINRHPVISILDKWVKIMDFNDPIIWVFLPTPLSLEIIDNFHNQIVIYYCIDNFRVSSPSAKKIEKSEIRLLKKADLVFVTSKELYDYCSDYSDKVHIFPFAVNFQEFQKVRLKKDFIPNELRSIKRPIIGYIGGVHKWIDFKLIEEIAKTYIQYSLVFIGPIQTDISSLSKIKNVYFLGKKDHEEIPGFTNNFDICIIPYLVTEYTKNVYPTKLNEYLALGKPVVATDLPEIANFNKENNNIILVGKNSKEFIDCISMALRYSDDKLVEERISSAKKNSWITRTEQMNILIEDTINEKSRAVFDWWESFSRSYKRTRKKFLSTAVIFLSIYILVFYTPLVWFLASPLKISRPPEEADCIVVFAGGVGESGRAGQGYEERVKYAVELYKRGYAQHIIFSSGYMRVFEEPMLMKALAVALGVPEEAIILEDRANNTYENIVFSKQILDINKWNKILLVSSPYHMLRVSLAARKVAGDIKIIYTPIPDSIFYSHPARNKDVGKIWQQINAQQIHGIFHEYLGILYYWLRGLI